MNTMRMKLLIPLALLLVAGALLVPKAKAEVRVNAIWRTPDFSIQIGNDGHFGYGHRRAPLPIRRHMPQIRLLRQDKQIAKRLSNYTGVPKRALLRYRTYGYTWRQIGRWLELPRPAIRAAMHQGSWQRYLNRRYGRGGYTMDHGYEYGYGYGDHDRGDRHGGRGNNGRGGKHKRGGGRHGR